MHTANLLTSSAIGLRKVLHFIVIVIILNYRVLNYNLILKILPGKYVCTAVSRKVVAKTVHATIAKGNMGYDQ